mgnify:CR=1 FL=1
MKVSNAVIILSSVITVIVTTALFQIIVPMINNGGECRVSEYTYSEICDSLIGFDIPTWWRITSETAVPVSIFFGILCGAIVAVYLLLKTQNPKQLKKDEN